MNDLELDALAFRWRDALDKAADSLAQVGRSRRVLRVSPAELGPGSRTWSVSATLPTLTSSASRV